MAADAVLAAPLRLRRHVRITQHDYRGATWHVLSDATGAVHLRCDALTAQLLQHLDGRCSVAQAMTEVAAGARQTLDNDTVIRLLSTLLEADLLTGSTPLTATEILGRRNTSRERRWLARLARPLFVQVPLINPTALLSSLQPVGKLLFSPWFNRICVLVIGVAVLLALRHADGLAAHLASRFGAPLNLASLWLLYPLIKLAHELAHGLTCRRYGGEVREMGVMLLVLMPVPYVDASASAVFASKWQRLQVAAAGIVVELLVAALALLAWCLLEPGLLRDLAFNAALISGISTLLFNGNPLLRFDGYYVLADLIEIPALARRANDYLGYLLRRYLLNIPAQSPVTAPGERGWFVCYGLAAGLYRLTLSATIALLVASQFHVAGVVLAAWFLWVQLLLPWLRGSWRLLNAAAAHQRRLRTSAVLGTLTAVPLLLLFAVPVTDFTYAEGLVIAPEDSIVRTQAPGFATTVPAAQRSQVLAGATLLQLENSELELQARLLAARRRAAMTIYGGLLATDRMAATNARQQAAILENELTEVRMQISAMHPLAPATGTFVSQVNADDVGRYLPQGTVVGYVDHNRAGAAQVVLPERDAHRLRADTDTVRVKLAAAPGPTLNGRIVGGAPRPTQRLPSRTLGSAAGGPIPVDMRVPDGLQAIEPVVVMQLALPAGAQAYRIGQTVHVRFEHGTRALGWRLLDGAQRLLPPALR